jgi:hypothetical protein
MKMKTTVVNTDRCGKTSIRDAEHVDPVVVIQHTEGSSEEEERNNYTMVLMMEENDREQK